MIREAQQNDLEQILNLYLDLHEKKYRVITNIYEILGNK